MGNRNRLSPCNYADGDTLVWLNTDRLAEHRRNAGRLTPRANSRIIKRETKVSVFLILKTRLIDIQLMIEISGDAAQSAQV